MCLCACMRVHVSVSLSLFVCVCVCVCVHVRASSCVYHLHEDDTMAELYHMTAAYKQSSRISCPCERDSNPSDQIHSPQSRKQLKMRHL